MKIFFSTVMEVMGSSRVLVMEVMGFQQSFIDLIIYRVKSITFSVLVNGEPKGLLFLLRD